MTRIELLRVGRCPVDSRSGELYNEDELAQFYSSHTTEEIEEFEKHVVRVDGTPEAIAEMSAKLAAATALEKTKEEALRRAWKKLR